MNETARWARISATVTLAFIFICCTWRGLVMFFSGDDMMNMYGAWGLNPWRLARAQLFIWMPLYRPLGDAVYRIFYSVFGFHPLPLYVFCWLLLGLNAVLAYRFFQRLLGAAMLAFTALSLILVHGAFQDLYLSAGTIYDRLWFLFMVLGLAFYAKLREGDAPLSIRDSVLVCLLCVLSMDSKESGVALPALMVVYDLVYRPSDRNWRVWLRSMAPLYATLALISVVFVFLRVNRTPELVSTPAYKPHVNLALWFTRAAEYFTILCYQRLHFSAVSAALVLCLMTAAALVLRNKAMMYGLLFFAITITPVALIASRPGYVLYVPDLGLALFFAALIGSIPYASGMAGFAVVTMLVTWVHARNWPEPFDPHYSPEYRLTQQFSREYPKLSPGTRMLFVTDEFPKPAYDLLFNLRLMYHDKTINADRMEGLKDQQPDFSRPVEYAHVFVNEDGRYVELDNRNPRESIRLHILRNYTVGREMDISRGDHGAYVVSGLMDGDSPDPSRWTGPHAQFKFDLYPAPADFTAKFWVPDFVAKTAARSITISVNGAPAGTLALTRDGMNEIRFPVPANHITLNGYTLVDMDVANPWKDKDGTAMGVVLLRAGFEYQVRH